MAAVGEKVTTRNQILDATDRIMARFGFRKMTMDDLAKEAGFSKRTIYLYFSSKEDVGLSSIGRVVEAVHERLGALAESKGNATDRLREMLMVRVMGRIESIKDYYHSLDELFEIVRPAYMARRKTYFDREVSLLAGVLIEGQRSGEFSFEGAQTTATTLMLATNAFLPYSLSVRELGQPEVIEERLTLMVDLLLRGLRNNTGIE
jgi:AcrR family transcriptional regulator